MIIHSEWIENTDLIEYDPKKHWNPQLHIENLISATKEVISYNVTRKDGFNLITETRQIKGKKKKVSRKNSFS